MWLLQWSHDPQVANLCQDLLSLSSLASPCYRRVPASFLPCPAVLADCLLSFLPQPWCPGHHTHGFLPHRWSPRVGGQVRRTHYHGGKWECSWHPQGSSLPRLGKRRAVTQEGTLGSGSGADVHGLQPFRLDSWVVQLPRRCLGGDLGNMLSLRSTCFFLSLQ